MTGGGRGNGRGGAGRGARKVAALEQKQGAPQPASTQQVPPQPSLDYFGCGIGQQPAIN
jgi:hypothetical protein